MADVTWDLTASSTLAVADAVGLDRDQLARRVRTGFRSIARNVDATVTLEIGAFRAGFSRWVRENLPAARAIAFEANPFVYEHYRAEVTAAGVDYRHLCISAATGSVILHVPRVIGGRPRKTLNRMSSLQSSLLSEQETAVTVPGARLDDVAGLSEHDRVVAWVDAEGGLEAVLSGSRATLSRASAAYVEVESEPMWDKQWLDSDVAAWFAGIGMVPVLRDRQRPQQYNLLFLPEESLREPDVVAILRRALRPPPVRAQPE